MAVRAKPTSDTAEPTKMKTARNPINDAVAPQHQQIAAGHPENAGTVDSTKVSRCLEIRAKYIPMESEWKGRAPDAQGDLIITESYMLKGAPFGRSLTVILPIDADLRTSLRQLDKIMSRLKKKPSLISSPKTHGCSRTLDFS